MRLLVSICMLAAVTQTLAGEPQAIFDGTGADMPKQPQVCMSNDGVAHLTFGVGDGVYYCRADQGKFNKPQMAFRVPNMSLGMRRGPRIAVTSKSVVITAIGGPQGKGKDGDLISYRSIDGGQTWLGPLKVNDVAASAREGLHAMTSSDNGTYWCVWLDLRAKRTELFASHSKDGGATWSKNALVYESPERNICECCHPSIVAFGNRIQILFRNSLSGNRDMYTITSTDGGATFGKAKRLGLQHWELNACPMDGGMLALGDAGKSTEVWRRGGTIYVTHEGEANERSLGKGEQSWIAMDKDKAYVVWTNAREGDLMLSTLDDQPPRRLAEHARDPVVAACAKSSSNVIVVWESRRGDETVLMGQSL